MSRHFDDAALAFETLLCLSSVRNGRNLCLHQGHLRGVSERNFNEVHPTSACVKLSCSGLWELSKLESFLGQQTKQYFSLRLRCGDGRKAPKSPQVLIIEKSVHIHGCLFSPRPVSHASRRGRRSAPHCDSTQLSFCLRNGLSQLQSLPE